MSMIRARLPILTFVRNYAKPFNTLGRRSVDTTSSEQHTTSDLPTKLPEKSEEVAPLSGIPEEFFKERTVRIFTPAKNSMQSGSYATRKWLIDFDTKERWENTLMGWGSSGDSHSNVNIEFSSKEDAIIYCERMGYNYEIEEKHESKADLKLKSYGANFSWNKKTRISTK